MTDKNQFNNEPASFFLVLNSGLLLNVYAEAKTMKKKIPVYILGLVFILLPFKFAYLSPAASFSANLLAFLSVICGFLVILIFGASDGNKPDKEH